ncbi:hypothetical protein Slit_0238 [Sideroxydans lithotrophicus ES-1]|uniref:Uncharacterized protein n=1 Tax=Sideroxydans lithotrophicus (strain ES-1) TaxID=580332 RepID=D5CUE5_SIDLE|nr:hypothetical protein Slit_0238 [Sideroxydans lithotrophicus ES-1]
MLLARAGFDPHKVLDMTEAEIESHLSTIAVVSGAKPPQGTTTRRFKGHRKTKKP